MTKSAITGVILASLILHGCILVGDAGTRIEGRITDMDGLPYDRCEIEVFSPGDDVPFDYRQITGEFNEPFVIFVGQTTYKLRFSCDDATDFHVIEKIELGPLPNVNSTVNVGTIQLQRLQKKMSLSSGLIGEVDRPTDEQIITRWQEFFDGNLEYQRMIEEGYSFKITSHECDLRKEMLICSSEFQITDPDGSVGTGRIADLWRRIEDGWGPW